MKNKFFHLIVTVVFCLPCINYASYVYAQFPVKFDSSEYIFIGNVIDYIGPVKFEDVDYWGFIVEVKEEIYLPEKPEKYFEIIPFNVFEFQHSSWPEKEFKNMFPKGYELRIVAKKEKQKIEGIQQGNIRLTVPLFGGQARDFLSHNLKIKDFYYSTAASEYNYEYVLPEKPNDKFEKFIKRCIRSLHTKNKYEEFYIDSSIRGLYFFELRKDFYRLTHCKNDTTKAKIFFRIKNCERYNSYTLIEIINRYINDKYIRRSLYHYLFIINRDIEFNYDIQF